MSFLSFRHAKRKAKKIVSIRAQRPPNLPSPDRDSCIFPSVVEIGDPSRVSAEAYYAPTTLHVDVDFTSGPLFPSDPFLPGSDHLSTNAGQSQDQVSHSGLGGGSFKLLHDGAGSEQQRDGSLAGSTVNENVAGTPGSRRTLKATPTPIKIPIPHVSKVQIQRSASRSTVPDPTCANTDSPVLDDNASVISGITLPGALIANVWTVQADQPRDHRLSRCITRTDSATLPHGEQGFMNLSPWKYAGLSNEDGEFLVPPVPPLPTAVSESAASLYMSDQGSGDIALDDKTQSNTASSSGDQAWQNTTASPREFSASKPQGISPTLEPSIRTPSNPGTPDLIKDSATSAGGGSSDTQLQTSSTSDSAPSAWSGPVSSSSPRSGREITIVLNFLSPSPSNRVLALEKTESSSQPSQAGVSTSNRNLDEPASSDAPPSPQRRSGVSLAVRRATRSRSSSRPSLASVNTLLLHPATLLPVGERRRLPFRNRSESMGSTQAASPGDTDTLSTLPSALGTSLTQHISQLPSFPESAVQPSAFMSPSVPSSLGSPSPPSSPDPLDNIVLADGTDMRAPNDDLISAEQRSPDEFLVGGTSAGEQRSSRVGFALLAASGSKQTFPETPDAFSPMFTPNTDSSRVLAFPNANSLAMRHPSVTRSLRVHSSRQSQRFFVGRSASTRVSMEIKARMKSSRSKLKRASARNFAANSNSGEFSSRSPEMNGDVAATTKPNEVQLNDDVSTRPQSMASDDPLNPADSRMSASARRKHSESQIMKIRVPPTPLTLPPSPPPPPSPREPPGESVSNPTSPSLRSLPPPPPPPKLRRPPPPFSQSPVGSPSPRSGSPHLLATRPPLAPPPPFDGPSLDNSPTGVPRPTLCPRTLASVAPPDHLRASPLAPPAYNPTLPPNGYSPDRPPRPLGPRALHHPSDIGKPGSRDGLSSGSSTESISRRMGSRNVMPTSSSTSFSSNPGPRFQTSPPNFTVLTLEAAKWSLSSEELQAIVSEAIRQSGGVSFIRLLPQQAAFVEVPGELERLTALQNELKVQYRLQVRKRDALLKAIYACSETPEFNSFVVRSKLQELNETTENLDKVAEELYNARDQAAQLSRMLAVHSGSALAMALRKLHSSFANRTAEMRDLKDYVSALEAERDEAWAQAQQVAKDLDNLNDTLQSQDSSPASTRPASRRSSRVMASRKSSIRLSKAGLRLSRGQRASMASQIGSARLSYASSAGTQPTSPGPIPPVPPIPDRLSTLNCITTPGLSSMGSARTSELSFSSEAHALARAQAELYGYLGIDDPELRPSPLRRSSIAASPSASSPVARGDALRRMSDTATDRWTIRGGGPLDRFQAFMETEVRAGSP